MRKVMIQICGAAALARQGWLRVTWVNRSCAVLATVLSESMERVAETRSIQGGEGKEMPIIPFCEPIGGVSG